MNASHKQPEITAVILAARVDGDRISGLCYGDKNNRFLDGEYITTSAIVKVEPNPTGDIVYTRNSVYKVVYIQPAVAEKPVTISRDALAFAIFKESSKSVGSLGSLTVAGVDRVAEFILSKFNVTLRTEK